MFTSWHITHRLNLNNFHQQCAPRRQVHTSRVKATFVSFIIFHFFAAAAGGCKNVFQSILLFYFLPNLFIFLWFLKKKKKFYRGSSEKKRELKFYERAIFWVPIALLQKKWFISLSHLAERKNTQLNVKNAKIYYIFQYGKYFHCVKYFSFREITQN